MGLWQRFKNWITGKSSKKSSSSASRSSGSRYRSTGSRYSEGRSYIVVVLVKKKTASRKKEPNYARGLLLSERAIMKALSRRRTVTKAVAVTQGRLRALLMRRKTIRASLN